MRAERRKNPRPPLDGEGLERLALFYAGRYATTRSRLASYLRRKVKERGWSGDAAPPIDGIVERFTELGYIDDRAFASARAGSLQRRGYGERRVEQALHAAGIAEDDAAPARAEARDNAWDSALRFAKRKRLGPFAPELADRAVREKAFAAMLRAGHPMEVVRKLLNALPGEFPDSDMM